MKTAILALLIFHGVWAWGQTREVFHFCPASGAAPKSDLKCIPWEPLPDCGEYEHPTRSLSCAQGHSCSTMLGDRDPHVIVHYFCTPNIHTVTEREWQELMTRLKALAKQK